MTRQWLIEPRETLFFRGGQPFNAGETGYIRSEFPPSPQVMQGFVRSNILAAHGISWPAYNEHKCDVCGVDIEDCRVGRLVGRSGTLETRLNLSGPFLLRKAAGSNQWTRYYPVPRDLVRNTEGDWSRLAPGPEPVQTDLGWLRLPLTPEPGVKVAGDWWMPEEALHAHLLGEDRPISDESMLRPPAESGLEGEGEWEHDSNGIIPVAYYQPKFGIQVDRRTDTVAQHMLYTAEHLRLNPHHDIALGVQIGNPPAGLLDPGSEFASTLGGERRQVRVAVMEANSPELPGLASKIEETGAEVRRFRLVLLQPAVFDSGWLPDEFREEVSAGGTLTWHGELNGLSCTLVTACVGRPLRVGGWDIANHHPRPMRSVVPQGSVYFFETEAHGEEVVSALHGRHIGQFTGIGYGTIMTGRW